MKLYEQTRAIPWQEHIGQMLRSRSLRTGRIGAAQQFSAMRVKDAIATNCVRKPASAPGL